MSRATRSFTISLPEEMAAKVDEMTREAGCTRSALLREALRRYILERETKALYRYGERKAKEKGVITEEQVAELIHARRHRESQAQSSPG